MAPVSSLAGIRTFARKVKGVARLKEGYLAHAGGGWLFIHRGLFKSRTILMDEGRFAPARFDKGSILDSLVFLLENKPQEFFVPKDWSRLFTELKTPPTTRLVGSTWQPY